MAGTPVAGLAAPGSTLAPAAAQGLRGRVDRPAWKRSAPAQAAPGTLAPLEGGIRRGVCPGGTMAERAEKGGGDGREPWGEGPVNAAGMEVAQALKTAGGGRGWVRTADRQGRWVLGGLFP